MQAKKKGEYFHCKHCRCKQRSFDARPSHVDKAMPPNLLIDAAMAF